MEDYKEKYKKVLERAKAVKETYLNLGNISAAIVLESIFPELKESEDERIRKFISHELACLRATDEKGSDRYEELTNAIAWLEKPKYTEEDLNNAYKCADEVQYRRGYEDAKKEIEKQGEQNPVPNWMSKFLDELRSKKNYFDWDENKEIEGYILAIIKWMNPNYFNEKQGEQKHICKLDNSYAHVIFPFKAKVKSSGTIVTICGGQLSSDGKEWIKYQSDTEDGYKVYEPDNLELVCEIEQNPAWSEEDERMLENMISSINHESVKEGLTRRGISYSSDSSARLMKDLIDWLKSLKERCTWKPSDEQMQALSNAGNSFRPFEEGHKILWSLYNDLKKLREE